MVIATVLMENVNFKNKVKYIVARKKAEKGVNQAACEVNRKIYEDLSQINYYKSEEER